MFPEVKHLYGDQVHILDNRYLNSVLAKLCHPNTFQPTINELVHFLYMGLVETVLTREFPAREITEPTRMTAKHKDKFLTTTVLDTKQKVVTVNLARAGTLPSQVCYTTLNYVLNPEFVRQDHIIAARQTDDNHQVVGTTLHGSKIGGDVDGAILLFPDPMGATGGTIISTLDYYKKHIPGIPKRIIALHLIITPEYLAKVLKAHKNIVIYALRVDRGLSANDVLKEIPGKRWSEEHGLDENQYIVPGGGGFGEILNNSYV